MARSFARIPVAHPNDTWSTLTPIQQWAITLLERLPKVNLAGCVDVKLSRWAQLTAGVEERQLVDVLEELEDLDWICWDRDTEELAIRDHCRQDHVLSNYKSARGLWAAWDTIESDDLRTWLLEHFPAEAWDPKHRPRADPPTDRTTLSRPETPESDTAACGQLTDGSPITSPIRSPITSPITSDDPSDDRSPITSPKDRRSITDPSPTDPYSPEPSAPSPQPPNKSHYAFNNATSTPVDNSEVRTTRLVNHLTSTATHPELPTPEQLRTETHHVIADLPADATDDQVLTEVTRRVEHPASRPTTTRAKPEPSRARNLAEAVS